MLCLDCYENTSTCLPIVVSANFDADADVDLVPILSFLPEAGTSMLEVISSDLSLVGWLFDFSAPILSSRALAALSLPDIVWIFSLLSRTLAESI